MNYKKGITNLILVTSDNCAECIKLKHKILKIQNPEILIYLTEYNIDYFNSVKIFPRQFRILITPALFVNNRLMLYGDTDIIKLHKLISSNINQQTSG